MQSYLEKNVIEYIEYIEYIAIVYGYSVNLFTWYPDGVYCMGGTIPARKLRGRPPSLKLRVRFPPPLQN